MRNILTYLCWLQYAYFRGISLKTVPHDVVCHTYILNDKLTHPKRVTVWCGFWSRGITGPVFFENEQGETVTVNGARYRAVLNEFLFTKIEEKDIGDIWFQQDSAACHKAEATLDVLRPEYRIIGRRVDVV